MSLFRNESPNLGPFTSYSAVDGTTGILYANRILELGPISASSTQGYWVYENTASTNSTETELITKIILDYTVAGPASLTLSVRKVTAQATAPTASAGATVIELLTTPFTLDSAANTTQIGSLVTSAGTQTIKPGNKIGISISSATQTGLAGLLIQLYLSKVTPG